MLQAEYKGKLIEAEPNLTGYCPACEAKLIPKCGEEKINHWAHPRGSGNCKAYEWSESETPWHLHWKKTFPRFERIIRNGEEVHVADVLAENGTIIEFQHSPIDPYTIRVRERFYKKMFWVVNFFRVKNGYVFAEHLVQKVDGYTHLEAIPFYWPKPKDFWDIARSPVLIDLGDDYLYRMYPKIGVHDGLAHRFHKKRFIEIYGGDYNYFLNHREEIYN